MADSEIIKVFKEIFGSVFFITIVLTSLYAFHKEITSSDYWWKTVDWVLIILNNVLISSFIYIIYIIFFTNKLLESGI